VYLIEVNTSPALYRHGQVLTDLLPVLIEEVVQKVRSRPNHTLYGCAENNVYGVLVIVQCTAMFNILASTPCLCASKAATLQIERAFNEYWCLNGSVSSLRYAIPLFEASMQ